jgi:hypothetical protein
MHVLTGGDDSGGLTDRMAVLDGLIADGVRAERDLVPLWYVLQGGEIASVEADVLAGDDRSAAHRHRVNGIEADQRWRRHLRTSTRDRQGEVALCESFRRCLPPAGNVDHQLEKPVADVVDRF